jgi:hypothetical protein
MVKRGLFLTLTFLGFNVVSQNFLACYNFAAITTSTGVSDPTPLPVVNGLTFGSFKAIGTHTSPSAAGRFSFTKWPIGGVNSVDTYSSFTGSLSPGSYYEVSIIPQNSFTLTLQSITFTARRSGTGVRNYSVRSNLDNFTNNLNASTGSSSMLSVISPDIFFWNSDANTSDQNGSKITFGNSFSALTDTVTFRFYAWNAEGNAGTFSIDSVVFIGTAIDTVILPDPVGVKEMISWEELKIYPTPMYGDKLIIESQKNLNKIEIVNVLGEILVVCTPKINNELELDISSFSNGTYYLRVYLDKGMQTKRLCITDR